MSFIEWSDELSVKHEGIDGQHKEWIRIINVLHDNLINCEGKDLNRITTDSLLAVKAYGEKHFKYEEGLLKKLGYPGLAEHEKEHCDFYQKIENMYQNHVSGEIVLNSQLMKMLQNWLTQHIMVEDMKLVPFLDKQADK